jgi:hypothetical protein
MNTKKIVVLSIFSLLIAGLAMAQVEKKSNFYVKGFGGYGLLTPGSFKPTNSSDSSFASGKTGMGKGLHFGGGIGFTVSDFLNVGVDAEYLHGNNLIARNLAHNPGYYNNDTITYTILSIIPNITFKALSRPSYFIYTRIGVIFTASTHTTWNQNDSSASPSGLGFFYQDATKNHTNYNYGINLGVQAALGVQFMIKANLRGFVEIVGNYLPISPNTSDLSSYTIRYAPGGGIKLSDNSATPTVTHTSYVQSGNFANNQQAKLAYNVNYIGANIGLVYRF